MAKPNKLCKLKQGKSLAAFPSFVDTFNWLVDFCDAIKGDADKTDGTTKDKGISVDKSVDNKPVIRIIGDIGGGGGSGGAIKFIGTDGSEATAGTGTVTGNVSFASASDSAVDVHVDGSTSESGTHDVTITIGVYFK